MRTLMTSRVIVLSIGVGVFACSSSGTEPGGTGGTGGRAGGGGTAAGGKSSAGSGGSGSAGKAGSGVAGGGSGGSAGSSGAGSSGAAGSRAGQSGGAGSGGNAGGQSGGAAGKGGSAGGSGGSAGSAGAAGKGGNAGTGGAAGGGGTVGMMTGGGGAPGPGPTPGKKFVGNITTKSQVRDDFAKYWDQITPEYEGKWNAVEAQMDTMNWTRLDAIHDYAKQHNILFKQHNFVWGQELPTWIGALPPDKQRQQLEEWIRLFCERYPDVAIIDVVNEPEHPSRPPYADALGGAGVTGKDWVIQPFKWARQYCPNAVLVLNDWGNLEDSGYNSQFTDLVKALRAAGAPIDAVGAQAHDTYRMPDEELKARIDTLASAGVPIYITECDMIGDEQSQADVMKRQFPIFWNDDRIKGITFWGWILGKTWAENAGTFVEGQGPRPALTWLMQYIGR